MKDYLDFKDGEVIDNQNSSYIDQIDDINHEEEIIQKKDISSQDSISIKNLNNYKEEKLLKEYEEILRPSDKEFLDDYDYFDDTKQENKKTKKKAEEIPKKVKKEKVKKHWFIRFINKFLALVSFLLRIIFLLLLFFAIIFFTMFSDYHNEQLNVEENKDDIEEVIDNINKNNEINEIDTSDAYFTYKTNIQQYIDDCTQIINGELLIIENLKENLITEQDVYNYFYITLNQKSKLINAFSKENFPTELKTITNYCKQILIFAETNSKTMINHYILGNNSTKMINDMNDFFTKYLEQLTQLNNYLNSLN